MKMQVSFLHTAEPVLGDERDLLYRSQLWGVLQVHSRSWQDPHTALFGLVFFFSFSFGT